MVAALKNKKKYARLKHRLTGANFDAEMSKDILNFVLAQEPIEIESLRVALQVNTSQIMMLRDCDDDDDNEEK